MEGSQKPLELILARNLLTALSTPAFLVDRDAHLTFYNEAAGALLGVPFEDAGKMNAEDWTKRFGPFDDDGNPLEIDENPLTVALRDRRPGHANFVIRGAEGESRIAASAMPVVSNEHGSSGAIIIFWPLDADAARQAVTPAFQGQKEDS